MIWRQIYLTISQHLHIKVMQHIWLPWRHFSRIKMVRIIKSSFNEMLYLQYCMKINAECVRELQIKNSISLFHVFWPWKLYAFSSACQYRHWKYRLSVNTLCGNKSVNLPRCYADSMDSCFRLAVYTTMVHTLYSITWGNDWVDHRKPLKLLKSYRKKI